MKYSFAAVALAAAVYAQDISQIPSCALPCIEDAVTSGTSCSISDYPCICENKDALTSGATSCVIDSCGATVAATEVLPAVDNFCEEVAAAPAPSSSAAAPSTSAAAPSSSAAAPSTSAAAPSTSAAAPSSSVAATTSAQVSAYPTSVAASSTLASTTKVNGTASATTGAPTSVVTAGAAVAGSIGSLAMMALGLAAAL